MGRGRNGGGRCRPRDHSLIVVIAWGAAVDIKRAPPSTCLTRLDLTLSSPPGLVNVRDEVGDLRQGRCHYTDLE